MIKYILLLSIICFSFLLHACEEKIPPKNAAQTILDVESKFPLVLSPEFSWQAFLRYWHRGIDARIKLNDIVKTDEGYFIDYGKGVTLNIYMKDNLISGLTASFNALKENYDGGKLFLVLAEHLLVLGTFGWTKAERKEMTQFYDTMSPQKLDFAFKNSFFSRSYTHPTWTFHWVLVKKVPEVLMLRQ